MIERTAADAAQFSADMERIAERRLVAMGQSVDGTLKAKAQTVSQELSVVGTMAEVIRTLEAMKVDSADHPALRLPRLQQKRLDLVLRRLRGD